jgi:hypothetical protein
MQPTCTWHKLRVWGVVTRHLLLCCCCYRLCMRPQGAAAATSQPAAAGSSACSSAEQQLPKRMPQLVWAAEQPTSAAASRQGVCLVCLHTLRVSALPVCQCVAPVLLLQQQTHCGSGVGKVGGWVVSCPNGLTERALTS